MKIPLQDTAETSGSVINQDGRKCRYSLTPSSFSNEVARNGPSEQSKATEIILEKTIEPYLFREN